MEGHDTPEAWVAFAWPYFRALQQTVVRNGTVLTTDEDNLAELTAHAESFRATTLPILQSLGVAEWPFPPGRQKHGFLISVIRAVNDFAENHRIVFII
jgi:hypothetical protein